VDAAVENHGYGLGLFLQKVPLFANLDEGEFTRLTEVCARGERRYKQGDQIVRKGDDGDELHLLLSGTAYAQVDSEELEMPKPIIVKNYSKGDYLGEVALMEEDGKRTADVFVSSGEALCAAISRQDFRKLVGITFSADGSQSAGAGVTNRHGSPGAAVVGGWRKQVSDVNAIEQWRTVVRRYLWLDLLHDTIDQSRTMQGRKSHAQTEQEVRDEIEKRFFFFAPDDNFVSSWQLFQVLVLVFTAIIVPLRAGFDQIDMGSPVFWFVFDVTSDVYFYFDILLNFRTAYISKEGRLIYQGAAAVFAANGKDLTSPARSSPAMNYATGWFLIDASSVLPIAYILYILEPSSLPWRAQEGEGSSSESNGLTSNPAAFACD
jgi:hypothetical protein